MENKKEKIKSLFQFLIIKFKIKKKVTLRMCKMRDHASCNSDGESYFISINKDDCVDCCYDSCVHEVAHVLQNWRDKEEHSENWGIWYSRVYRAFLEWYTSENNK